ncbi:AroM family protein [Neorhizobium sp. DAR64861/K0K2]|uniref:AroM family protein n=1 Tax=Neorhizobium sp. DAR64861/K0K2 TaxID=3421956 RepID=UPI003D2895DD
MFLSVGQSPRTDIIDDMLTNLDLPIEALEVGALDGLSDAAINELRVRPGETSIVTRLADGSDIIVSKPRIAERMAKIAAAFQPNEFDLVVILSTGLFRDFESTCPMVNAQRAMESTVISLAAHGSAVGLIQPLQQQIDELDIPALAPYRVTASYAADGDKRLLASALVDLAETEIIMLDLDGDVQWLQAVEQDETDAAGFFQTSNMHVRQGDAAVRIA